MFVVGSYFFYPKYDTACGVNSCSMYGAMLYVLGSICFFFTSCVNFYKINAISCEDFSLTLNAALYLVANFLFIIGSVLFIPIGQVYQPTAGISLFMIGSLICMIAPIFNIHRARKQRQINTDYLTYVVECTMAVLYIGGSVFFLLGSIYYLPQLYRPFSTHMFVTGSFLFMGATLSPGVVSAWGYLNRHKTIAPVDAYQTKGNDAVVGVEVPY